LAAGGSKFVSGWGKEPLKHLIRSYRMCVSEKKRSIQIKLLIQLDNGCDELMMPYGVEINIIMKGVTSRFEVDLGKTQSREALPAFAKTSKFVI